jgi:uncharacterized phage protein gp47/JayE
MHAYIEVRVVGLSRWGGMRGIIRKKINPTSSQINSIGEIGMEIPCGAQTDSR